MRNKLVILLAILCFSMLAVAQNQKAEIFGGYQWTSVGDSGSGLGRQNFNGWNAALSGFFTDNFGITADFSGAYKSESGASLKVHSYMFGPVVHAKMDKATPFAHVLFGGAHASASASGFGNLGSDSAFAYAVGGGFDYNAAPSIAIRVAQFDYLGTRFGGETQKNFRYSGGIVLKF